MPDHSISVIVPAYNCAATIGKTIQAIVSQDFSSQIEVVVVDDGSTDATPQAVQSFSQVKYIRQSNSGPASARNRGVKESRGQYLFFTDSDCVPQPGWIKKMMPHFADLSVGVVAGSYGIANPANRLAKAIHQEILYRHQRRMPLYPSYFGSFNFASRREIFEEAGGFDASYRNASGEDNDLSYKIIARGHKIYFAKDALVDHFHTESLQKYLREQYRHGFWRVKMYLNHPKMSKGDDYTFWKDIFEIPAALLFVFLIVLSLWNSFFLTVALAIAASLMLLEIYYGIIIMNDFRQGLFWGVVMFMRAVARSWGFVTGVGNFLFLRIFSAS